jgi:pre-mRNA-processing factor 40
LESGAIKARSKWKHVYPHIANDERYLNMLGNPGSNPIELFWDVVDHLDQLIDEKITTIDSAVRRHQALATDEKAEDDKIMDVDEQPLVNPATTLDGYLALVKATGNEDVKNFTDDEICEIYYVVSVSTLKICTQACSEYRLAAT